MTSGKEDECTTKGEITMNTILEEIFDKVIYKQADTQQAEQNIDNEIKTLLEQYHNKLSQEDYETMRGLMYAVEAKSMREGYQLGIKHALLLIISLIWK